MSDPRSREARERAIELLRKDPSVRPLWLFGMDAYAPATTEIQVFDSEDSL